MGEAKRSAGKDWHVKGMRGLGRCGYKQTPPLGKEGWREYLRLIKSGVRPDEAFQMSLKRADA